MFYLVQVDRQLALNPTILVGVFCFFFFFFFFNSSFFFFFGGGGGGWWFEKLFKALQIN